MEKSDKIDLLKTVFDAIPYLIFVVDEDIKIYEYNSAAAKFLLENREAILKHRGGEVLHCIHSTEVPEGCGRASSCKDCVIRNSVTEAFHGNRVVRRRTKIEIIRDRNKIEFYALITASHFRFKEGPLVLLLIEDISEIAELQRIIPICSVCKKVRDEKEAWSRVEMYLKEHWDVDFSHSLCPNCYKAEMDKAKKDLKAISSSQTDTWLAG